jgi:hypothetical protein
MIGFRIDPGAECMPRFEVHDRQLDGHRHAGIAALV